MPAIAAEIRRLVADISRHDTAAPVILATGAAAVPALSACLDDPPQSVSHARRFAVAMLEAIPGSEATVALRRVLHCHDVRMLPPHLAEPERLVQNDAFAALTARLGEAVVAELDCGLDTARLPAAVTAVGRFAVADRIPTLVEMLADDYLAGPAYDALARLGAAARLALLAVFEERVRDVIALRRACAAAELLGRLPDAEVHARLARQLTGRHPALSATVALALAAGNASVPPSVIAAPLARGALLPDAALAARCLDALASLPTQALLEAARAAVANDYLPDAYGAPHAVRDAQRARVTACLLTRPDIDATPLIEILSVRALLAALRAAERLANDATIAALRRHPDKRIREATAGLVFGGS